MRCWVAPSSRVLRSACVLAGTCRYLHELVLSLGPCCYNVHDVVGSPSALRLLILSLVPGCLQDRKLQIEQFLGEAQRKHYHANESSKSAAATRSRGRVPLTRPGGTGIRTRVAWGCDVRLVLALPPESTSRLARLPRLSHRTLRPTTRTQVFHPQKLPLGLLKRSKPPATHPIHGPQHGRCDDG